MKKRIGLQGFLIFSAVIATIFLSKYLFPVWKKGSTDEIFDFIGIFVLILGFLFRIAARGYKMECSGEGKNLIKAGPYRLMRNPMYFGTLLIGLGITLIIFQWWVFLVYLSAYLAIYLPQIKKEENLLRERFGQEFQDYCKTTPRFFPRIPFLFRQNLRECIFFKWSWIGRELISFLIVAVLVVFAESWKDAKLFGRKEFFKELVESIGVVIIYVVFTVVLFHGKENPASKK